MAVVESAGGVSKKVWGVTYDELAQKQYDANENATLYSKCMVVLKGSIDSYNKFKDFLLNNYSYTFGYLQDYLTTAKDNFENGYQSGIDNFSSDVDSIIGVSGDGGIVEEYKTAVENILNQIDPKVNEFIAAYNDASEKFDAAYAEYEKYTNKINRGEYDTDYD